ncbi:hypothetical protein ASPWEDRAFT_37925 [Aspergillus wentii DTO 134E9]|uniref:DUF7703 domain-containing protein n=1 Tax=Aspergillus wentii DTO 134E9 TaxID=1073089 RepID=A0A1L9RNE8_ASPWE|nr:uncharacterized protein ASPWEDRAFT_37925 [Aspergillus wentii DTO 134E9]OJJ36358.1 hypothetical protein ASPWEDRAFT_37925 [Aspergillus wentii DTO 134E9]
MSHPEDSYSATVLEGHAHNSLVAEYVFATFIGLAWCNAIELIILCLLTFKRYHGYYFWSLLVASFAIIPFGLGYILKIFGISNTHHYLEIAIVDVSWIFLITGQSLVLWSRLHLVLDSRRVLRGILYLIITNMFILQIPSFVLEMGTNSGSKGFARAFNVMERIQLVGFCLQELLISGLYIVETVKLLRLHPGGKSRGILIQLIIVNVLIMLMDVCVVAVQYASLFTFQVTLKALVYSIKLKLEYVILGRLVDVAHLRSDSTQVNTDSLNL